MPATHWDPATLAWLYTKQEELGDTRSTIGWVRESVLTQFLIHCGSDPILQTEGYTAKEDLIKVCGIDCLDSTTHMNLSENQCMAIE
jgi:hypothetical protein